MAYQVNYTREAMDDLDGLRAYERVALLDAISVHLTNQPMRESKSRIKRLVGVDHPQYRLRVDELRVFYDVEGQNVVIIRILDKDTATSYLEGLP